MPSHADPRGIKLNFKLLEAGCADSIGVRRSHAVQHGRGSADRGLGILGDLLTRSHDMKGQYGPVVGVLDGPHVSSIHNADYPRAGEGSQLGFQRMKAAHFRRWLNKMRFHLGYSLR